MADGEYSIVTKLGLGALTISSALAIYRSWGDAGSVTFVLAADAAFLLLFLCLREFERRRGTGSCRIKAAMWALTTLLTVMFGSGLAPIVPLAVGVLVFICLCDAEGGGEINMDRQYCALGKVGFAVLTCYLALDAYDAGRDDPVSAALVFVSYAVFLILTFLFVCAFARAHAAEHGHDAGCR